MQRGQLGFTWQVCIRVGYGINYVETFKYGYECLIDSNRTKNFLAMGRPG